jgi:hypothetical protein
MSLRGLRQMFAFIVRANISEAGFRGVMVIVVSKNGQIRSHSFANSQQTVCELLHGANDCVPALMREVALAEPET